MLSSFLRTPSHSPTGYTLSTGATQFFFIFTIDFFTFLDSSIEFFCCFFLAVLLVCLLKYFFTGQNPYADSTWLVHPNHYVHTGSHWQTGPSGCPLVRRVGLFWYNKFTNMHALFCHQINKPHTAFWSGGTTGLCSLQQLMVKRPIHRDVELNHFFFSNFSASFKFEKNFMMKIARSSLDKVEGLGGVSL